MILILANLAPDCFSLSTNIQGNIQQRELRLILTPKIPLDPLCSALNNTIGTAKLTYSSTFAFDSEPFTYTVGDENNAIFSLRHLTTAQIVQLIKIQAASYKVKIQKAAEIFGTLESIRYLKIDVSACWAQQIFAYGASAGEEQLEFRLTPNDCVIPEDARMYPTMTFELNGTEIQMAEFQQGGEGEYRHPYIHGEVKIARLRCWAIDDEELREQCLRVVQYVTITQEYFFAINLVYETNGIGTNVVQTAGVYQAIGSQICARETKLTAFLTPDGFFIYNDQFQKFPNCIISENSATVVMTGVVTGSMLKVPFVRNYSIGEFVLKQNTFFQVDMEKVMQADFRGYVQYIQYDTADEISGVFFYSTQIVKQCYYLVVLTVVDSNTVQFDFRSAYNQVCRNISGSFQFMLISKDREILYEEMLNIDLDPKHAITHKTYRIGINVQEILKGNDGVSFQVKSDSFYYSGDQIHYRMDALFIFIQLAYFGVYITISMITVMVVLRMQKGTE